MFELPLFPLNTVLFPGMPMELHIFEERYKAMIGMCVEKRMPFGVVLLESGRAELDPYGESAEPQPFLVGCTAHITRVHPLGDGRMNILCIGRDRFQIQSFKHDKPYLVGMVDLHPLPHGDSRTLMEGAQALGGWMMRYLQLLEDAGRIQFDPTQLPNDPLALAYLGAVLLEDISPVQKQGLLAAEGDVQMVDELRAIYRREAVLLEALLQPPHGDDASSIALN